MPSENLTDRLAHITDRQDALQTVVEQQHTILAALVAADPPGLIPQLLTALDAANGHLADVALDTAAIRTYTASTASLLYNLLAITTDRIAPGVESTFGSVQDVGYLIQATACVCDSGSAVLAPPLSGDTVAADSDHCKRVQFLLDNLVRGINRVADMLAAGATMTSALAAACLGAGIIPGVDLASIPAGVIAGFVSLIGLAGAGRLRQLANWIADNSAQLRDLLYSATTPTAAQNAWYSYVDAHDPAPLDPTVKLSLKVIAWSGLINALYDPTGAVWDVTSYDGEACAVVFLGFPDTFTLAPSGQISGSGTHYFVDGWPARPYWTVEDFGGVPRYHATTDQALHMRVEVLDAGVTAAGLYYGIRVDGAEDAYVGSLTGYDYTFAVPAGAILYLAGYNGSVTLRVTMTDG